MKKLSRFEITHQIAQSLHMFGVLNASEILQKLRLRDIDVKPAEIHDILGGDQKYLDLHGIHRSDVVGYWKV